MALDATGTPTSPDSIPKYNTAVDPPSGKGFNAAMDAIQVALTARTSVLASKVDNPAGIVSGEAVVWDGTTWVRSSVTRITPGSLGSGTPSASNFLRGDGSWQVTGSPNVPATTLPASPVTGQQAILTDSLTAPTYNWLFQYDTAISGTYKWRFIGGNQATVWIATSEGTTVVAAWVDLATVGPTFTIPRNGDYLVGISASGNHSAAGATLYTGLTINATTGSVPQPYGTITAANAAISMSSLGTPQTLVAADVLKVQYFSSSAGTANWLRRSLTVVPVKVA